MIPTLTTNKSTIDRLDLDQIKREHRLVDAVAAAGIKLSRSSGELKALCPFHDEKTPSFTLYSNDTRFHCFGCGADGDVLDFVQHFHGVKLREAVTLLTGDSNCPAKCGTIPVQQNAAVEIGQTRQPVANEAADRTDEARAIWNAALPIKGTLAETYLRCRCLHLPLPDSLRFASLPYGSRGQEYPVLVAEIVDVSGNLIGIQRTYLAPDGKGKAAVPKPKLSLGRVSGGAIRLAPVAASLIVTEGLEDALTLQQELGLATWAAAGSTMMSKMMFPGEVKAIAIGGDADNAGRAAAYKAATAFANRGLHASTFFPTIAKDFNAELMEVRA